MKTVHSIIPILLLLLIPFAPVTAQNSGDEIRTIEITGNDQMKFDVTEITASPGETITIVLTTVSQLPKMAMAHNVVVLKQDADVTSFVSAAASARNNDFIPPDLTDQIIAYTPLAGGSETVEVTFTVPENEGSYEYICSFPGHYMAGMKGTLIVE
ncbi:MAG: plastocyanin/azurin family copper-binding protein [Balneolaceae bacterium]|nr:plastocyanin/azurin family copper-binding protein [Balneolaceae bacterium]